MGCFGLWSTKALILSGRYYNFLKMCREIFLTFRANSPLLRKPVSSEGNNFDSIIFG